MMNLRSIMGAAGNSVVNPEQVILDLSPYAFYAPYADGGVTEVNGDCSSMKDLSPNALHVTESNGARQPRFGDTTLNGLPVVTAATGKDLIGPSGLYSLNEGANSYYGVAWTNVEGTSSKQLFRLRSNATNIISVGYTATAKQYSVAYPSTSFNLSTTNRPQVNPNVLKLIRNGTFVEIYVGDEHNSRNTVVNGAAPTEFTFFATGAGAGNFNGNFAVGIFFKKILTSEEEAIVYSYFASRLGVTV